MSRSDLQFGPLAGNGLRFGVVAARYNEDLVEPYLEKILDHWRDKGVLPDDMEVLRVPGSGEIPFALNLLAETGAFDCLLAVGVIVQGDTDHHQLLAETTGHALQSIALDTFLPVINAIVSAPDWEIAAARCLGEESRAANLALTAIEMAHLRIRLNERLEDEQEYRQAEDWSFTEEDDENGDGHEPWKS